MFTDKRVFYRKSPLSSYPESIALARSAKSNKDKEQTGRLQTCLLFSTHTHTHKDQENSSQESSDIVCNDIPLPLQKHPGKKEQCFKKHCLLHTGTSHLAIQIAPVAAITSFPSWRNWAYLKIGKAHLTAGLPSASPSWLSTAWNEVVLPLPILPSPQRAWTEPFIPATA